MKMRILSGPLICANANGYPYQPEIYIVGQVVATKPSPDSPVEQHCEKGEIYPVCIDSNDTGNLPRIGSIVEVGGRLGDVDGIVLLYERTPSWVDRLLSLKWDF